MGSWETWESNEIERSCDPDFRDQSEISCKSLSASTVRGLFFSVGVRVDFDGCFDTGRRVKMSISVARFAYV